MTGVPKAARSSAPQAHGPDEGGLELGLGDALVEPAPGVRSEQGDARVNGGSALGDAWVVVMAQVLKLGVTALEVGDGHIGRAHLCLGDVSDEGWRGRVRCQSHARVVAHEEAGNGRRARHGGC